MSDNEVEFYTSVQRVKGCFIFLTPVRRGVGCRYVG